jgi:hypothetical protein
MILLPYSNTLLGGKRMEADYKKFRKVPPYMTKAGIQIGLLYQEPFEARMGKDEYAWQETFLAQRYKPVKGEIYFIDKIIFAVSVVGIIVILLGGIYGFI